MVVRKRAPGAGRPPKGEIKGKSKALTTRITPELRTALERERARSGKSISQIAEQMLVDAFRRHGEGKGAGDRNAVFGEIVARLALTIEVTTRKSWREDPFTAAALQHGVKLLLEFFSPKGAAAVPEHFADQHPMVMQQWSTPEGLGAGCAGGLITQIQLLNEYPPEDRPRSEYYAKDYYRIPRWRSALGMRGKSKGADK